MKILVFQWFRCFVGSPPCWRLAGLSLASCWSLAGLLLASCRLLGFLLASRFSTRISLENRFFKGLAKMVNSLHENTCFSMVSVFRGLPPMLASCWPLVSLLLVACWPLAGFLPASWLLAGFKVLHEDFSRKSVFQRARKTGEFSS